MTSHILSICLAVFQLAQLSQGQRPICPLLPCKNPPTCDFGFVKVGGCDTCQCVTAPQFLRTCQNLPCHSQGLCPDGFKRDSQGCLTCACFTRRETCTMQACLSNECPFGRVYTAGGCPTCQCKGARVFQRSGNQEVTLQCPGGCPSGYTCVAINTLLTINSISDAIESSVIHACAPPGYRDQCSNHLCPEKSQCRIVERKAMCLGVAGL